MAAFGLTMGLMDNLKLRQGAVFYPTLSKYLYPPFCGVYGHPRAHQTHLPWMILRSAEYSLK